MDNWESLSALERWVNTSDGKSERAARQRWHQVHIQFADWRSAERLAVTGGRLGPRRTEQTDRDTSPEQLQALEPALRRLMTIDTGPASTLVQSGPLRFAAGWMSAFDQAGQALSDLGREGLLTRGLRAILAHHIIFHWNRLGLPYQVQSALARTARDVVLRE